jgi:hypothetical protein
MGLGTKLPILPKAVKDQRLVLGSPNERVGEGRQTMRGRT